MERIEKKELIGKREAGWTTQDKKVEIHKKKTEKLMEKRERSWNTYDKTEEIHEKI